MVSLKHSIILGIALLVSMYGIQFASAGSPVQDPNTCTFWDSILDIFYEADCGSQYVGLTQRSLGEKFTVLHNEPETTDKNSDGIRDVITKITELSPTQIKIDVTQTNDGKGQQAYKWTSAICSYDGLTTITKEEYNPSTQVWANTGSLQYGLLVNYGMPSNWCQETNGNGFVLFGSGSGNKTYRLNFPNSNYKLFKILTGEGTDENVVAYQETSTIQFKDVAKGIEINDTVKKLVSGNWEIAPNNITVSQSGDIWKTHFFDAYATNDTQNAHDISSNTPLWRYNQNIWIYYSDEDNYYGIDFDTAGDCSYKGCDYNYTDLNGTYNLFVNFTGRYNAELGGVVGDPAFIVIPVSGNLYTDTKFQSATNTHLEINDTAYRYAQSPGTSNSLVDTKTSLSLLNDYSISFWVNMPAQDSKGVLTTRALSGTQGLQLLWLGSKLRFTEYNSTDLTTFLESTNGADNTWNHYVIGSNDTHIWMYRDNVYQGATAKTFNMTSSTGLLYLMGAFTNNFNYQAIGKLDEVMVFNKSINSTEISEIYNLGRLDYNYSTANVLGYWNFNGGTNNWEDAISNTVGTSTNIATYSDIDFDSYNAPQSYIQAYYSFDADSSSVAYDLTNNDNDGTITNAINTSGIYGSAKYFDGDNDVVTISSFNTDYFTFNAWVNPTNLTNNLATLGTKWSGSGGLSAGGWLIDSYVGAGVYTGIRFVVNDGTARSLTAGAGNLTTNEWQMITTTYDGTGLKIYRNGNLITSSSFSGSALPALSQSIYLANTGASSSQDYNGSLDEVMIFSTALNSTQISEIYNNQSERFKPNGTASFRPVGLNETVNLVNITLTDSQELYGTDVKARASYWNTTKGYNISQGSLTDNLVMFYPFDENANDLMAGQNLSLVNSPTYDYGVFNSSLDLNYNSAQYGLLQAGNNTNITNAITISGWINYNNLKTVNGYYTIVGKRHPSSAIVNYAFRSGTPATSEADELEFYWTTSGTYQIYKTSGANLVANEWYHVTVTYQNGVLPKVYVNGILQSGSCSLNTCLTDLQADNNNLTVGWNSVSTGNLEYFNGSIDNLMIFNKSLSIEQVKEIYNKGLANWDYSDVFELNTNKLIDSSTTIRPELVLYDSTAEGWYTPYVTGNITLESSAINPEIALIPITSNGTQAEGVQIIQGNLSLNYSSTAIFYLNYSNGTLYDSQVVNSPNLNYTWTSVPFGDFLLYACSDNGIGNTCSSTNAITLSADTTDPFIEFISPTPANDTTHGGDNMLEVYTNQTDANPKNVTYYLFHNNGSLVDQHTLTWTTSPETLNWNFTIPISGMYYWYNATACDDYDNCNSTETRRVYVDFEFAVLDIILPLWENLYESTYVPLSYFASDPSGVAQVWYNVLYSSNGTNSTYISNTTLSGNTTITITDIGSYYLNLWANDTTGNVGYDLTFFDVTNVSAGPEGPQGPQGPQGPAGANGTSVDLLSQICKYKKLGYYNEELPFLKEVSCI